VTEDAIIALRESLPLQPRIERGPQRLVGELLGLAPAVDMVDRQELDPVLAAAGALAAIGIDHPPPECPPLLPSLCEDRPPVGLIVIRFLGLHPLAIGRMPRAEVDLLALPAA
jgi:hypothetical protein